MNASVLILVTGVICLAVSVAVMHYWWKAASHKEFMSYYKAQDRYIEWSELCRNICAERGLIVFEPYNAEVGWLPAIDLDREVNESDLLKVLWTNCPWKYRGLRQIKKCFPSSRVVQVSGEYEYKTGHLE